MTRTNRRGNGTYCVFKISKTHCGIKVLSEKKTIYKSPLSHHVEEYMWKDLIWKKIRITSPRVDYTRDEERWHTL